MPDRNRQKKIAIINDMSGFGRCSIAVELPIISHMKIQCCPVPTSIFSNHTAYESFFFEDFTEKMIPYIEEWKKLGLTFDGICSGFLGSERQIEIVQKFFKYFKYILKMLCAAPNIPHSTLRIPHLKYKKYCNYYWHITIFIL